MALCRYEIWCRISVISAVMISGVISQKTKVNSGCSFATGDSVFNIQLSRGAPSESCPQSDTDKLLSQQKDANDKLHELMYDVLQLQSSLIRMMDLNNNLTRQVAQIEAQLRVTKEALRMHQAAAMDCPPTYDVKSDEYNSCYMLVLRHTTWLDAETYCMSTGGHLVALETQGEQEYIVDMIRNNTDLSGNHIWAGGNDFSREGLWTWTGMNTEFNHTAWLSYPHPDGLPPVQNPDNYADEEHCLQLSYVNDYQWNDAYCGQRYYFICEFKLLHMI